MNIIKIQNMLRGVADEALIGYVQNPQGEVPSYLALSELQRRKDTRAKYQAEQAPESSVAEDLGQEAMPNQGGLAMLAGQPQMQMEDQGVAGLPVDDDMYQEDSFAAGGIVAFADGGDTSTPWYKKMKLFGREYDVLPPSPSTVRDLQSKTRLSPFMGGLGDIDAYQYADPNYLLKKREMLYKQLEMPGADKNAIYAEINALEKQTAGPAGGYVPTEKAAMTDAEVQAKNVLAQTPPPPAVNPYAVDSLTPRPLSVEEAMKRQEEAMKLAGVDPNFYKTQAADLLAQREALKADRSEAANMALIRAGLATMGGTSPFALVNLGKGAEAGTEQYMQDARNIRAENRLLGQADLKLKEAQNAQQRGDAQGAIKAIQERENLIAQYNHYKMTTGATLEAARIGAGVRTGAGQLPALYNALNKAQQAGNQTLVDQIQSRIDDVESGGAGVSSSSSGWKDFKESKPKK
jgi:hypothetical protein